MFPQFTQYHENGTQSSTLVDQRGVADPAGLGELFHAGVFQPVFAKGVKADFQHLNAAFFISVR